MSKIVESLRDCKNIDEWRGTLLATALSDGDRGDAERASLMLVKRAVAAGAKLSDDLTLRNAAREASAYLAKRH